jgi:hypothetical protein
MKLSEYVAGRGQVERASTSWPEVEAAIRRLDGRTFSGVMFEHDSRHCIGAAGGNVGRYFVFTSAAESEVGYVLVSDRMPPARSRWWSADKVWIVPPAISSALITRSRLFGRTWKRTALRRV